MLETEQDCGPFLLEDSQHHNFTFFFLSQYSNPCFYRSKFGKMVRSLQIIGNFSCRKLRKLTAFVSSAEVFAAFAAYLQQFCAVKR